jgi:hypothetical protein
VSIIFFGLNDFSKFFDICSFCFNISYIDSLQYIPCKINIQKCMYIEAQIVNQFIFFNFKSPTYIWCIYIVIFFIDVLFFKLAI